MTMNQTTGTEQTPAEFDTELAGLYGQIERMTQRIASASDVIHRMAGDRRRTVNRDFAWGMTLREAREIVGALAVNGNQHNLSEHKTPREALAHYEGLLTARRLLQQRTELREAIWRIQRWSRYILCDSSNGHIHNYTGCHTLRPTSKLVWFPEYSGRPVDEAVADRRLGPILCQVCFPDAKDEYKRPPAEWRRERDAGARDAAKAEREAKQAAKTLTDEEQFRTEVWRDRVTTVAACKQIIRYERELYWYYGHGPHPSWQAATQDAENARAVLLAREERHEGYGATQEEIDRIHTTADRKHRKEAGK